jgi:hypothetical protein
MSVMWNGGVDRRVGCEVDTHGSGHVGQRQLGVERGHLHAPEDTGRRWRSARRFAVRAPAAPADPSRSHPWHDS